MDELNIFENLIIIALSNVNQSYYQTTYNNIQNFRRALEYRNGRFFNNDFERFGERVFCYEFYHQLRILIDNERINNPLFLDGALLQAEVEKMQIIELVERFGLRILRGRMSPDFLMHTPGNANFHPYVIEVKCEHELSSRKLLFDLEKIDQFITRYNYQRGIFLAINVNNELIQTRIDEIQERINELEGRNRIKIISKTTQLAEHRVWQL
ncbi:hypothetical protein GJU43_18720 [Flavobacterium sp. LC2016-23]|uniref:hypothetical protein n=1 Tax=Flavobacterium sp. LC2016-23 TaxID=2666330 RepID=UPI0012B0E77E|nr:hypothetical protein [Flavobacterium sp. LC2016-23]MRX41326.1 hypothetical protein [Flavobacterium sp. LC2016-23]